MDDSADRTPETLSGTEQALFPGMTGSQVRTVLDGWIRDRLGSPIRHVRFRSGRIDVVWGVELADGRAVVIKTHRPPVDQAVIGAAQDAQRWLGASDYPCAVPLAGPDDVDGRVLTAESLIVGASPDGREPRGRRLLAAGLAGHIELLRGRTDLVDRVGPGPSWCRYQSGPWPVPHDTLVDFSSTPAGFGWIDTLGRRAADQILLHREAGEVVLGHADWYAGNVAVADGVMVGTYDWELVADTEAVLAGFAAACYAASSTGGGGLSTPGEAGAFLCDYEAVRSSPLSAPERRAAAGAVAWIVAFNARWQIALIEHGLCDPTTVGLAEHRGEKYLSLSW